MKTYTFIYDNNVYINTFDFRRTMTKTSQMAAVAKAIVNGDINSRRQVIQDCKIPRRTLQRYINMFIEDKMVFRVGCGRSATIHFTDAFRKRVKRGYYNG